MELCIKPPLGVKPHWFVYRERIVELNEAINRQLEHISAHHHEIDVRENYKLIAKWAKEIQHLASLEAELEHL